MADVFISHSSKDKEIADRLCAFLEQNGLKCWIAPRDIEPGCEWPVAISEAIQNVQVMVVIYSNNSATSTQVPKELTLADKRKKKILPYKIDDTELFGSFDYFLSSAHWILENKENPNESFQELFRVISNLIGSDAPERVIPVQQRENQVKSNLQSNQTVVSDGQMKQPARAVVPGTVRTNLVNSHGQPITQSVKKPQKALKKKKTWLIPVCIAGGLAVVGVALFFFVVLVIIGANVGSTEKDKMQADQSSFDVSMQVSPVSDFEYMLDDFGATISAYIGDDSEVVVPAEIEGVSVVQIGLNAFANNTTIKTVYLPNSVAYICAGAFANTSLETIYLPNGLKRIENSSFYKCANLKRISLPNSLRSIDSWAFAESGLEEILLPDSVERIMELSFYKCSDLKKVTFSNNLKSIGKAAFSKTALTEVSLPDSITYMDSEIFFECLDLQKVKLPVNILYVPSSCFYGCTNLSQVKMPEELIKIESFAFAKTDLQKVDFSKCPLRYIGIGAFLECMQLSEVLLPDTILELDNAAFQSCQSLTDVFVPESIQMISSTAFIYVDGIQLHYGNDVFLADDILGLSAKLNDSLAAKFTFSQTENGLTVDSYTGNDICVVIPGEVEGVKVEAIADKVFSNNKDIHLVVLSDSIKVIGNQTFMNCSNLFLVAGGANVTNIGHSSFAMSGLVQPFLPVGLTVISNHLYFGCENITDIYAPYDVIYVGENAFGSCKALMNASFSQNTQSIDKKAFSESVNVEIFIPYWIYTYQDIQYIPVLTEGNGV